MLLARRAPAPEAPSSAGSIAPLTGLADPSGLVERRCAVTVKIGNTPEARPQYGVEGADAVYEEVVEGGITRLAAVFQSQAPDRVGPVRSVRSTDQSIVWPLRGIFAYSGGSPAAVASLTGAPVTPIDETAAGPLMFRDPSRAPPHNLYAHVDQLYGRCEDPPPPALFTYRPAEVASSGDPVSTVRVGFEAGYEVTWRWDPGSSTWLRSIFGGPDLDPTGEQLSVANVVVMPVRYARRRRRHSRRGGLTGQGPVSVFTDGKVVEGTWVRPDRAEPALLLDRRQQPDPPDAGTDLDRAPRPQPHGHHHPVTGTDGRWQGSAG